MPDRRQPFVDISTCLKSNFRYTLEERKERNVYRSNTFIFIQSKSGRSCYRGLSTIDSLSGQI